MRRKLEIEEVTENVKVSAETEEMYTSTPTKYKKTTTTTTKKKKKKKHLLTAC